MEPTVIFQDDSIIVLNKPAGWIVNDANTTAGQPVLQTWLSQNFQFPISNDQNLRSGIVHRLDKETSGILLVAKTEDAFYELQRQFKDRIVKKTYVALVHGKMDPKVGEINATVGRLPWRRDRFGILPGGRESSTSYKVLGYYELPKEREHLKDYSLVEFYPKTGRTHQIRIHAKFLGHPLVSDEFYTGRKTSRADRKWCPHLYLYAAKISFIHPVSSKLVSFEASTPAVLIHALDSLVRSD